MLERIKNIVELSKYKPEKEEDKIVLKQTIEDTPKGMVIIVEDDPINLFPDENDQTS